MSNLPLEKRILYSTVYCAYREYRETGVACRHTKSFGVCDLDVCPIVQNPYASIIFQRDGIYLVLKKPSSESIAGEWEYNRLSLDLDGIDETIKFVEEKISDVNPRNKEYLLQKLHNIVRRYKFLREKGKSIPVLEEAGLEELVKEAEKPKETAGGEEESLEELEELELLDIDEIEEE